MIYLYVKIHKITGLKYLGKTKQDPFKYSGSGKYWKRHLKIHGRAVDTFIIRECQTNDEIKEWGIYFSLLWNVVNDTGWANLTAETGTGGNNSMFWTDKFREENKRVRSQWTAFQKGKTYEEIYGDEKAKIIKAQISLAGKGRKLTLTDEERKNRADRAKNNNPGKYNTPNSIKQRVKTFKERGNNIGSKNGMNTKIESRKIIGEKNSRIHYLRNIITGEEIEIKNITQWARNQGLNSSSVLVWFCKGKSVNGWIRLSSKRIRLND